MCNQPLIWIFGPIFFWLFHGGAIAQEEKLLREKFGDDFNDYCKSVPRFVSFSRIHSGKGEFSLQQLMLNKEYKGMAGTLITVSIFALLAYTPDHGMPIQWLISRFF